MLIKFCCTIGLLFFCQSVCAASVYKLARNEKLIEQWVAEKLLAVIYQRAGLAMQVTPLPPARATYMMQNQLAAGEVARIYSYGEKNPSFIRVEPSYYTLTTAVFANKKNKIVIKNAADLARYRVAVIRGVAHSAAATESHKSVEMVNSAENMFEMLNKGRFEVIVDTGINGRYMLNKYGYQDIEQVGEIKHFDLYHYLHPHVGTTAVLLSNTIQKMKESGELETLRLRFEREILTEH